MKWRVQTRWLKDNGKKKIMGIENESNDGKLIKEELFSNHRKQERTLDNCITERW